MTSKYVSVLINCILFSLYYMTAVIALSILAGEETGAKFSFFRSFEQVFLKKQLVFMIDGCVKIRSVAECHTPLVYVAYL